MGAIFQNPTAKHRYIPKHQKHEESIQKQVCHYLRLQYPHVIFRSDYSSGLHLTPYQAKNQRSMQSGRAWPDLFIYHPSQHDDKFYAGLALELKREGTSVIMKVGPRKGRLSTDKHIQEQALVLKQLNRLGYYANFAVGFDEAIKIIDWYMGKPQNASIF